MKICLIKSISQQKDLVSRFSISLILFAYFPKKGSETSKAAADSQLKECFWKPSHIKEIFFLKSNLTFIFLPSVNGHVISLLSIHFPLLTFSVLLIMDPHDGVIGTSSLIKTIAFRPKGHKRSRIILRTVSQDVLHTLI
jgi:hypothetical protein